MQLTAKVASLVSSTHKDESRDSTGSFERRSAVNLERHIQTIMIAVITGALFFAANYVYSDNRAKAVQQTQLEVLTSQVFEMRADLRSLQTNYVKKEELRELDSRIRELEKKGR